MRFLKRSLTVAGALALLVILLTLAAPKQAHALVTTWVTVVNAIGNPVITQDTPHMASQLVTLFAQIRAGQFPPGSTFYQIDGSANESGTAYTLPQGRSLVITTVEFYPQALADAPLYFALSNAVQGYYQYWKVTSDTSTSFQYPSGIALSGAIPLINIMSPQPPSASFYVYLHGYLTTN